MTSEKQVADENFSLKASAERWLAPRSDQTGTSMDIVNWKDISSKTRNWFNSGRIGIDMDNCSFIIYLTLPTRSSVFRRSAIDNIFNPVVVLAHSCINPGEALDGKWWIVFVFVPEISAFLCMTIKLHLSVHAIKHVEVADAYIRTVGKSIIYLGLVNGH